MRWFSCWVGVFLLYFCEFLTTLTSDVLLEGEGANLFVIYHNYVILGVETGTNNSELIPKSSSVEGDHSL